MAARDRAGHNYPRGDPSASAAGSTLSGEQTGANERIELSPEICNLVANTNSALKKELNQDFTQAIDRTRRSLQEDIERKLNDVIRENKAYAQQERLAIKGQLQQLKTDQQDTRQNTRETLIHLLHAVQHLDRQQQQLIAQQQAQLAAAATSTDYSSSGAVRQVVHFCQEYSDCDPVHEQFLKPLLPPSLEIVRVHPNSMGGVKDSETLVWVMFTHTGRWLDDLRGQKELFRLLEERSYKSVILVTLRNTEDPKTLPSINKDDEKVRQILNATPMAAVYFLFDYASKQAYSQKLRTQYNGEAVEYNESSAKSIMTTIKNIYRDHIIAYDQQVNEIKRLQEAKQKQLKGAASSASDVSQALAKAESALKKL